MEGNPGKLSGVMLAQNDQIEELQKKIRLMELANKKRTIELENELKNEQRRAGELQDSLIKTMSEQSDYTEIKAMNEHLQTKLIECEQQVVLHREKEMQLSKQIRTIKETNPKGLSSPYSRTSAASASSASSHRKNPHNNQMTSPFGQKPLPVQQFNPHSPSQSNEDSQYNDIDKKELIRVVLQLKQENENVEIEMQKIREGAIDAIMEKERTIYELREQVCGGDQQEQLILRVEELLREKEEWQSQQQLMIDTYERQIQEYEQSFENEQRIFEERLMTVERELNERVLARCQQSLDSAKEQEKDLLAQIRLSQERANIAVKTQADQDKIIGMLKEQIGSQNEEIQQLKENVKNLRKEKERVSALEREMNSLERVYKRELEQKDDTANKLKQRSENLLKTCVELEEANKRYMQDLEECRKEIGRLDKLAQETQQSLEDATSIYNRRIQNLQSALDQSQTMTDSITNQKIKQGQHKLNDIHINTCEEGISKSLKEDGMSFDSPDRKKSSISENSDSEYLDMQQISTPINKNRFCLRDITKTAGNVLGNSSGKNNNIISSLNQSLPVKPQTEKILSQQQGYNENSCYSNKENNPITENAKNKEILFLLSNEIEQLKEQLAASEQERTFQENELQELSDQLRVAFKSMQESRRALSDGLKSSCEREGQLKGEIEQLKTHVYKIETHMVTYKLHLEEDKDFLRNELKIIEKIAAEAKVKLAQISQDKDDLQSKYNNLLAVHKNKKIKDSQSHNTYLRQNQTKNNASDNQDNFPRNFIVF